METSSYKQKLINFSILSVSLLIAMGSAISPALPSIAKAFPRIPISIVDMIGTVQQFAVLLALFVSVAVAHKIGIKYTIMAGIFPVAVSGLIPMFFNSFILIMLSRIVLGCGIGFFNSLAIDIINLYFKSDDKQRVKMCGIRTSFEPLGQCVLNFACGFLVMISWHAAFAISLAAISIVLVGCNLGSFICPIGVNLLGHLGKTFNPAASTINNAFLMMFFIAFLISIVVICFLIYRQSSLSIRKATQKKLMMRK